MNSLTYNIPRQLRNCHSLDDIQMAARRSLPFPIYDFIMGGADDEITMTSNRTAFQDFKLVPRYARGIDMYSEHIDMSTTVLGQKLEWPFMPSPSGGQRLCHFDGEIGVARAAHATGTAYNLAIYSFTPMEEVAQAAPDGPNFFQMQPIRSPELARTLMDRAKAAGYKALIITVDNPTHGNRERDLRSGFSLQPSWGWKSLLSFACHPRWSIKQLLNPADVANFREFLAEDGNDMIALDRQLTYGPTWQDIADWVAYWGGPVAVKGLVSTEDMRLAIEAGASAIAVSNQGGRHFDGAASSFEILQDAVNAVGDDAELILDGGIRRGTDILKAVALGAKACMSARPHYYGLACGGEPGARHAFELLKAEAQRDMIFLGADSLEKVTRECLRKRG